MPASRIGNCLGFIISLFPIFGLASFVLPKLSPREFSGQKLHCCHLQPPLGPGHGVRRTLVARRSSIAR
jgi:hypothetical protein